MGEDKKLYYWVAGEDGDDSDKRFFHEPHEFLTYLEENDPCLCGSELMSLEEFNNLPDME